MFRELVRIAEGKLDWLIRVIYSILKHALQFAVLFGINRHFLSEALPLPVSNSVDWTVVLGIFGLP